MCGIQVCFQARSLCFTLFYEYGIQSEYRKVGTENNSTFHREVDHMNKFITKPCDANCWHVEDVWSAEELTSLDEELTSRILDVEAGKVALMKPGHITDYNQLLNIYTQWNIGKSVTKVHSLESRTRRVSAL